MLFYAQATLTAAKLKHKDDIRRAEQHRLAKAVRPTRQRRTLSFGRFNLRLKRQRRLQTGY